MTTEAHKKTEHVLRSISVENFYYSVKNVEVSIHPVSFETESTFTSCNEFVHKIKVIMMEQPPSVASSVN